MAPKLPPPANTKAVFAGLAWFNTDKETLAPATRVGGARGVLAGFVAGDRGVYHSLHRRPRERARACTHLVRRIDSGLTGGIPESGICVISIAALRLWQRCRHVGAN